MKRVYILVHKEGGVFYGCTDDLIKAAEMRKRFPNPEPIEIYVMDVDNEKANINASPLYLGEENED